MTRNSTYQQKFRFWTSFLPAALFVLIMALLFFMNDQYNLNYSRYGVYPRSIEGLKGILFAPFIHGSIEHLGNNSLPILVLSTALLYFYRGLGIKVFFILYLLTGILVWLSARESFHIGASGMVYAMAAFLFMSGILRKAKNLVALSLLVAFLYGSLVWGIFPVKERVSWESHLWGGIAGFVIAWYYRKEGPQRKIYEWEEDDDDDDEYAPWKQNFTGQEIPNKTTIRTKPKQRIVVHYSYKAKDKTKDQKNESKTGSSDSKLD